MDFDHSSLAEFTVANNYCLHITKINSIPNHLFRSSINCSSFVASSSRVRRIVNFTIVNQRCCVGRTHSGSSIIKCLVVTTDLPKPWPNYKVSPTSPWWLNLSRKERQKETDAEFCSNHLGVKWKYSNGLTNSKGGRITNKTVEIRYPCTHHRGVHSRMNSRHCPGDASLAANGATNVLPVERVPRVLASVVCRA